MNIYRISQDQNNDYDTYDSAVVVANTEEEARNIKPGGSAWGDSYSSWCRSPDSVEVELIGIALKGIPSGSIICTSFNAG